MKKFFLAASLTLAVIIPSGFAFAAPPQTVKGVIDLFTSASNIIQTIFWILAVVFIILAAFKYLTAQGDETKVKAAKSMLIYAIIAIAVALLATSIKPIVDSFLGGETVTPGTPQ